MLNFDGDGDVDVDANADIKCEQGLKTLGNHAGGPLGKWELE